MIRTFLVRCCVAFFIVAMYSSIHAQGTVYSFLGGLSLSNQEVSGYQAEPFLRFHCVAGMESTSDINPNAMYFRLGYHTKGSAIVVNSYTDDLGMQHDRQTYSMEFHNISASLGWKQRRPLGDIWYSYGFGVRFDYNVSADFGQFFAGLAGTQNKITYGVDVDIAMEFPLSELVSTTIEIGVSPDLGQQIYIPPQNTGWHYSDGSEVILGETKLTNLVFEVRAGFRFWRKVIYTD